ncbi:MAG: O-antigen ligase family protein [Candidatus Scalindua sp.]
MINYPAKLIKKALQLLCARNFILFILICLFAYSVAEALLAVMRERTLGSVFRHGLLATPYLCLIILISMYDIRKFSFSSLVPHVPSGFSPKLFVRRYLMIAFLAVLAGQFSFQYLVHLGLLFVPVLLMIFISLLLSCYYIVTEKKIFGVIIFLAVIPFLYFIQGNLGVMIPSTSPVGFKGLRISEVLIPLSAIYLFTITILFFIGEYQSKVGDVYNKERGFIKLCMVFILMPVFSITFSKDPSHSFVYYLMDLILPFIYFLILMKSLRNLEDLKTLIFALIISVFIYEFFALYFMQKEGTIKDISIGLYTSNIYAGFSSTFIPLILPFQIAMYALYRGWKRALIVLMLVMFIFYLFLSNYRTAILSSAIGLFIFYFLYYRIAFAKKLFLAIVFLLFLVISLIYTEKVTENLSFFRFFQSVQQLSSGQSFEDISSGRVEIWRATLKMVVDHPLLGIGPDMWNHYISQYMAPIFAYKDAYGETRWTYPYDPHNLYLLIWINYGILSFICYFIILCIVAIKGINNIKRSLSHQMRVISIASFISLIQWMLMSCFTMRFYNHSILLYAIIFWTIIAVIFKINEFNSMKNINNEYAVQEK